MLDVLAPPRAVFSPDGVYRYRIERTWDASLPPALWIGLNPSKAGREEFFGRPADGDDLDPTCRKEIAISKRCGVGSWLKGNLFALVSTDPKCLRGVADPVGPENDAHLLMMANRASLIVCCWGNNVKLASPGGKRARDVMRMIREECLAKPTLLACFRVTKEGHVEHSLYQRNDAVLTGVPEELYV
jgi:hypothetical protein